MTNNLNPADVVIVPRVASDEMSQSIFKAFDIDACELNGTPYLSNASEVYQAAISAAPPNNFIPVDKGEWERLKEALSELVKVNEDWNADIRKILPTRPLWNDSYLDKARAALEATNV